MMHKIKRDKALGKFVVYHSLVPTDKELAPIINKIDGIIHPEKRQQLSDPVIEELNEMFEEEQK